jgi:hypothetical protein
MGTTKSGSCSFYFSHGAPVANYNPRAPTVSITVVNKCPAHSVASATLAFVSTLPPSLMLGHVMPSFPHTLIGLGPFANQGYKIVFDMTLAAVFHPDGHPSSKVGGTLTVPNFGSSLSLLLLHFQCTHHLWLQ